MSANHPARWFGPHDKRDLAEKASDSLSPEKDAYFRVMKSNIEAMGRKHFEQRVFNRYFVSKIGVREPGACFRLNSGCDKTLAELCAKNEDGDYTDPAISAMWFGYSIGLKSLKGAEEIFQEVLQLASK